MRDAAGLKLMGDAMALQLPSFGKTECQAFTACGELRDMTAGVTKWLSSQESMAARYSLEGHPAYIKFMFGGRSGKHFHVDVASGRYFRDQRPIIRNKLRDLRQAYERLEGRGIQVHIAGDYSLSPDKVPAVFRSVLADRKSDETESAEVRVADVTFAFRSGGFESVRFSQPEVGGEVRVGLEMTTELTTDDGYLVNCLAVVDRAFAVLMSMSEPERPK